MSIFSKIKSLFVGKKQYSFDEKAKKIELEEYDTKNNYNLTVLSVSSSSYIDSMAAKICIGAKPIMNYAKIVEHIEQITKRGHESIMGHSDIVMLLEIDSGCLADMAEITDAFHFLEYSVRKINNYQYVYLIGGSIRAYKYFLRNIKDPTNFLFNAVKENLYISAESVYFKDLIDDGIMDESKFEYTPKAETFLTDETENAEADAKIIYQEPTIGNRVDIIYAEDPYELLDTVKQYGFDLKDVLKICVCSIVFHDFSRAISQQMTRQLAGISQESQRYVNYSECGFIEPTQFEDGKSDSTKLFTINIFGTTVQMTPQDLGNELIKVYPQLIEQGMLKQDARGFLPFNVPTKVMMTFTYKNLIHFIKERTGVAAQPEIQSLTLELIKQLNINKYSSSLFALNKLDDLINLVESPQYKQYQKEESEVSIDDVISEEEIK
jgi:flavin-dependent thymidylate synthase